MHNYISVVYIYYICITTLSFISKFIVGVTKAVIMVDYETKGDVAILHLNNPPVNALGSSVRNGIYDAIDRIEADQCIKAVVITGRGQCFCAGADIKEFSSSQRSQLPNRAPISEAIENCSKPVVAAIHGYALGGGLEVALGAHYRVAHQNSTFGFPEVDIGILPGGGGTQRMPRLTGLKTALEIIPTGKRFNTAQAAKWGIVDKVVTSDIVDEGIKFAQSVIGKPISRCSEREIPDLEKAPQLFENAISKLSKAKREMMSTIGCIQALRVATQTPFNIGREKEKELFRDLVQSGQARALQYAFFAQRTSSKWRLPNGISNNDFKVAPSIKSAAVIGAGTMGAGIAVTLLNSGIPVTLVEQDQKALDAGLDRIQTIYKGTIALGKMTKQQLDIVMSILTPAVSYDAIKHVDIVIEAIFENLALKQEIFKKLDGVCKPEALLCSNTSTLSIDKIASATKRPAQVMGTHFFVPAYIMPLMENIYGQKTSPKTVATVMELGKKMKKIPVLVGNCNGFVGNRMKKTYGLEAKFMLEEGAEPQDVDQVLMDYGFPMGPFATVDLSGLDIGNLATIEYYKGLGIAFDPDEYGTHVDGRRVSPLSYMLQKQGRVGRKAGKGFYRYDKPGSKNYYPDPVVSDILKSYRQQKGIEPRRISSQEITERCLYPMINEGFKILEEKIVSKPEDIDTVWLSGFGWPRHTGGPMFYAKTVGLKTIYERLLHYQKEFPTSAHMVPCELLRKLSEKPEMPPMSEWADDTGHSKL